MNSPRALPEPSSRIDLKRNEWFGGGVILVSREADAAPVGEQR